MKYRKRPIVIEAVRWTPGNEIDIQNWSGIDPLRVSYEEHKEGRLIVPTLEGDMQASPGDWIIRGVKGEFYPCKPDIFDSTYEMVE